MMSSGLLIAIAWNKPRPRLRLCGVEVTRTTVFGSIRVLHDIARTIGSIELVDAALAADVRIPNNRVIWGASRRNAGRDAARVANMPDTRGLLRPRNTDFLLCVSKRP